MRIFALMAFAGMLLAACKSKTLDKSTLPAVETAPAANTAVEKADTVRAVERDSVQAEEAEEEDNDQD